MYLDLMYVYRECLETDQIISQLSFPCLEFHTVVDW